MRRADRTPRPDDALTQVVGERADFEATQHIRTVPVSGPSARPSFDRAPRGADGPAAVRVPAARYVRRRAAAPAHPDVTTRRLRRASRATTRGHAARAASTRAQVASRREREARRRRRGWVALILVLLLTTVAAVTGWYLTEGRFTSAPALTTLTRSDATSVARRRRPRPSTSPTATARPCRSARSSRPSPPAGARVRKGSPDRGGPVPRARAVRDADGRRPDLRRRHGRPARRPPQGRQGHHALERHGRPGRRARAPGRTPGPSLKRDTTVALVVSGGPQPIKLADWTGKDADKAAAALKKAGLIVTVTTANSDEVDTGDVISQDPPSGSLTKGDEVALVKSLGPVLVTVPNVRAMGIRKAEEAMQAAGFKTKTKKATNYLGLGYVVTSSPAGGQQAPKGSTITLALV